MSKDWYSKMEKRKQQREQDAVQRRVKYLPKVIELVQQGKTAFSRKAYGLALEALNQSLKLIPDYPDALFWRGNLYTALQDHEAAIKDYTRILKDFPDQAQAYISRGVVYQLMGRTTDAEADFVRGFQLSGLPRWQMVFNRSLGYLTIGDEARALDDLEEALSLVPADDPGRVRIFAQRGHIYMDQDRYDEAEAAYSAAIELKSDHADYYLFRGYCHSQREDYETALADMERAVQLAPDDPSYALQRGYLIGKLQGWEAGIEAYNTLIERFPNYAQAYNNRGYAYSLIGQLKPSLADCEQALKLDGIMWNGYSSRGHTRFLMGELDAAIADFEHAMTLYPEEPMLQAGIYALRYAAGEQDAALAGWRELISAEPQFCDADHLHQRHDWSDTFMVVVREIIAAVCHD